MKSKFRPGIPLLPRSPGVSATRWIGDSFRAAILEGRLRPGTRLPATRDIARDYDLARGTVVTAFDQLKSEGYLETRTGSGTFVAGEIPDRHFTVLRSPATRARPRNLHNTRRLSGYGRAVKSFPSGIGDRIRAFRSDVPALDLFPTTLWAQIAGRRLRKATTGMLRGCDPMGYRPLQEAVADYLTTSRGVACVPGQVAIVSGTQEALDLTARLFLDKRDRVAIENPGYIGATRVFEAAGAIVSHAAVDDQGMVIDDSLDGARLVYVTPAHQFPLGASMSISRRLALLEWAFQSGAMIFEDDYDSEFRYSGRPMPALQGLDEHGQVIFAGSFSKVMFPSLRLGYMVVPTDLIDRFAAAQSVSKRHAPLLDQAVLADFLVEGHFGRHVRRMRQIYAWRLAVLLESAQLELAGLLEVSRVEAGLQTVAWLRPGLTAESVAVAAARRGVEVTPLNRYARGRMHADGLQIGFAAVDENEIRRGVRELRLAIEDVQRSLQP